MKFNSCILMIGIALSTLSFTSCGDDDNISDAVVKDMEKPVIVNEENSVPLNCTVFHKGETISFRYKMTDDKELGNFNLEIHNNFDHHTHSTEAGECSLEPIKDPVTPWIYNQTFKIPAGQKEYVATTSIEVPTDIDSGDYHFMIRLTDASGWQQLKAVSVKIID